MSDDEPKELDKEVKKLKRMANEQASVLHDPIEDRLPAASRICRPLPNPPTTPASSGRRPRA